MASTEKALTYEEERQRIIQENKRRMEELGLFETVQSFRKPQTPRKYVKKVPSNLDCSVETRRSSRAANRPKVDYREGGVDIRIGRTQAIRRPLKRRGYVSPAAKNEAAVRAGERTTTHPSFVKAMLKSHTSGGFWLGLPSDFCSNNFSKDDIIVLEDEDGLEWECVYLHHKHGLSGGWRGFSLDHDLEDGDAVVFELVESNRFKVYITRAAVSEELPSEKTTAAAKRRDYHYVMRDSKNVHVHSVLHKSLKMEKGDLFEERTRKRSKSARPVKRRVKSRHDSDESQESENVEEAISDEIDATGGSVEDSDEEDVQSSEEDTEDAEQLSDNDLQPVKNSEEKISKPEKRPIRSKQESQVTNSDNSHESEQESDDAVQPTKNLKEKIRKGTTGPVKSKQQPKAKTEPKARQITTGRKDSARVIKKETSVRRGDRKTDIQEVRKEVAARQIEQICSLPPGSRPKPYGVCSISRGSGKRKISAMFPARKYSSFTGLKSIKVN